MASGEGVPELSGVQMFEQIGLIDKELTDFRLSSGAHYLLSQYRKELVQRFETAAEYAGSLLEESVDTENLTPVEARIAATRQALAERYSTTERQLAPEDFTLVTHIREGDDGSKVEVSTVVLGAANGLDLGDPARSHNAVMADDEQHTLTIEGEQVDTRTGSTAGAYRALVQHAIDNELPLPDSTDTKDDGIWTATLLTGEPATEASDALSGVVYVGQARVVGIHRDDGYRSVRFRPAVVVAETPVEATA